MVTATVRGPPRSKWKVRAAASARTSTSPPASGAPPTRTVRYTPSVSPAKAAERALERAGAGDHGETTLPEGFTRTTFRAARRLRVAAYGRLHLPGARRAHVVSGARPRLERREEPSDELARPRDARGLACDGIAPAEAGAAAQGLVPRVVHAAAQLGERAPVGAGAGLVAGRLEGARGAPMQLGAARRELDLGVEHRARQLGLAGGGGGPRQELSRAR